MDSVDVSVALDGVLGEGAVWDGRPLELSATDEAVAVSIETTFGRSGWYAREAEPYDPPQVPFDDPPAQQPPVVEAVRRLWLGRWNPADENYDVPDIDDDTKFPWERPESAPNDGWWLSTKETPKGRYSIEEVAVGDLVICQRTYPGKDWDPGDDRRDNMLVGICVVGLVDSWNDAHTQRREREVCLVPLAKFTHPVPRKTAKARHRLCRPSFSQPLQRPGRIGPSGRGLTAVEWDDAVELLSVCGIPPEALAEPDTARLAARLRATETGNPYLLRLRYDSVLRDQLRRQHEREAERRAEAWAAANGYALRSGYQGVPLAGFDLLFVDFSGTPLQVEVKGYSSPRLRDVHLQVSQAWRATDAASGTPPDWRLFAVLDSDSPSPSEQILAATEVVDLLGSGGLQVKGGWPAERPPKLPF